MKKLTILFVAVIFVAVSLLAVGCGNNEQTNTQTSQSQTQSENGQSDISISARPSRVTSKQSDQSLAPTSKPPVISTQTSQNSATPIISGDTVTITPSPVPETASLNAKVVIQAINLLGTITGSNFEIKYESVLSTEAEYNKLTPSEKAEIVNYNDLLTAKSACEKFMSTAKVDRFLADYAILESAQTLDKNHVALVATLRSTYANFSQDELSKIPDHQAKKTKIDESYNTLKSQGLMEFSVIIDNLANLSESTFFTFNGTIDVEELGQDKIQLNGTFPSKSAKIVQGTSVTFTTAITGTLNVYAYRTDKLDLKNSSNQIIQETVDSTPGDDYTIRTYQIDQAGSYTLDLIEGEVFVLAIVLQA